MSNAEAPSTDSPISTVQRNAADLSSFALGPFPTATHLIWGIRLWAYLVTFCLVMHGVTRGLRGAFVGGGDIVTYFSVFSSTVTQATALITGSALVYLGLTTIRMARNPYLGILAALLGAGPTAIVFLAQKYSLNHDLGFASALLCGLTIVVCCKQSRGNSAVRWISALGGGCLLLTTLRIALDRSFSIDTLSSALEGLELTFRWGTLALVALRLGTKSDVHPLATATLLGSSLLLAQAAVISSTPDAQGAMLLAGRVIGELAPHPTLGLSGPFGFSFSLLMTGYCLLRSRISLAQLCISLIALGIFAPTTPLVCAWLTTSGFILVVICWVAQADHELKSAFGSQASEI